MVVLDQDCLSQVLRKCGYRALGVMAQCSSRMYEMVRDEYRRRKVRFTGDEASLLHLAAMRVDVSMARVALKAGISPDVQSRQRGLTPLSYLLRHGRGGKERAVLVKTLVDAGAKLDTPVGDRAGCTPLHIAAFEADIDVVRVLLKLGADPNAVNLFGQTPLHLASRRRRMQSPQVIHGADVGARTETGAAALHYGKLSRNSEIVRTLISRGVADGKDAGRKARRVRRSTETPFLAAVARLFASARRAQIARGERTGAASVYGV